MALSAATLGSLIADNLTAEGANGDNKTVFANAVAAGIVASISGKAFATLDAGLIPGTGEGEGTGIIGLVPAPMIAAAVAALPTTGSNATPLMKAIMNAVVDHLSSDAELKSDHTPVFQGTGLVVIGSIPVTIPEMAGNIDTELASAGANGPNKSVLSLAIATGIVSQMLISATGTVTITGSFTGSTPPGPVPGAGAGTGVIT